MLNSIDTPISDFDGFVERDEARQQGCQLDKQLDRLKIFNRFLKENISFEKWSNML